MANTVAVTKILEGQKDAVFHVYLLCDGASGELSNQTLIDPLVDLSPVLTAGADLTVTELWWEIVGFQARLDFDATAKSHIWLLNEGSGNHVCFDSVGGIKDRSGAGATGKLIVNTAGFTAATDEGSIIIKVRKN